MPFGSEIEASTSSFPPVTTSNSKVIWVLGSTSSKKQASSLSGSSKRNSVDLGVILGGVRDYLGKVWGGF